MSTVASGDPASAISKPASKSSHVTAREEQDAQDNAFLFLRSIELGDQNGMSRIWEQNSQNALVRYKLSKASNDLYSSPVHCAAAKGHTGILRQLFSTVVMLAGNNRRTGGPGLVNRESPTGDTPLLAALRSGSTDSVRVLLQNGADPLQAHFSQNGAAGKTPLCHLFGGDEENEGMMRLLLEFAARDSTRFEAYIDRQLTVIWRLLSESSDGEKAESSAEVHKVLQKLVWICEDGRCKPGLLKTSICYKFCLLSKAPQLCGCNLICLLHACVSLVCDKDGNNLDSVYAPALSQFLEAGWVERGLTILTAHWVPGAKSQAVSMTAMHLLIALFARHDASEIESRLGLSQSPANVLGMKCFFKALGAYSYFQCAATYPTATLRKRTGLMWLRFQYQLKEKLKSMLLKYPSISPNDLAGEAVPVVTKYRCNCSEQAMLQNIRNSRSIWGHSQKAAYDRSAWHCDSSNFFDDNAQKTSPKASPVSPIGARPRSESISLEKPPPQDDGLHRSSSFCDFQKLSGDSLVFSPTSFGQLGGGELHINMAAPIHSGSRDRNHGDGGSDDYDWLPSDDDEYVTNPPQNFAAANSAPGSEYSTCYFEAMSKIVHDISCGYNPIRPTERLDPFDLLHSDDPPPYLSKAFIKRRTRALMRQMAQGNEPTDPNPDAWRPTEPIQRLVRMNSARQAHQPPFLSNRWQKNFEHLLLLSLEKKNAKVVGQKECLILPPPELEPSFVVGMRSGAKVVLALVEEAGKKPRGVLVKVLPRDDLSDVCVKRLEYVMTLAQFPIDSLVLNYRLFLSDSSFWYLARPVCDWNVNELLDQFWNQKADGGAQGSWNPHRIFHDCMKGLHFLHTRTPTIFHGNLKPSNILVDSNGTARLVDFGFGKVFTPTHELGSRCVLYQNVGGRVEFDPRCWKPLEYFSSEKHYICPSDVQSMAMLGYYLLSRGQSHPFVTSEDMVVREMESAILGNAYHLSRTVLPSEAVELFLGMLSADPTERLSAADTLDHVYFWPVSRKAGFLLLTACQPELTLYFGQEPMLQTQVSTLNSLKGVQMPGWTKELPTSDPGFQPAAVFPNRQLDDSALSFLIYIRAFYAKHGTQDQQFNLLSKFVLLFPQAFIEIYQVVKESGFMSRKTFTDLQ